MTAKKTKKSLATTTSGMASDSVQLIARYIAAHLVQTVNAKDDAGKKQLMDLLIEYHDENTPPARKRELRDTIFLSCYFLIPSYLKRRAHFTAPSFDDACQAAALQLLSAIENFKPELNVPFVNYLHRYLPHAVTMTLRGESVVRLPLLPSSAKARKAAVDRFLETGGEVVSEADLAGADEAEDEDAGRYSGEGATLEYMEEIDYSPHQAMPEPSNALQAENELARQELRELLETLVQPVDDPALDLGVLEEREKVILTHRYELFGAPFMTLEALSEAFKQRGWNASAVWVHQLHKSAIRKLRPMFLALGLADGLLDD